MTDAEAVNQPEDQQPMDAQPSDADSVAPESVAPDQAGQFEPAPFQPSGPDTNAQAPSSMTLLHDVDMEVTVELGRTTMPIRELLALQPGMVVEIEREAGAPIDVLVNGRLIACGEVVVIDEEFGIRITEIAASGQSH